jgi:hypothetical protein
LESDIDSHRFDQLARHLASVSASTPRRTLLRSAATLGAALSGSALWSHAADARKRNKKKNKRKKKKGLCRTNGSTCTRKSKKCQAQNCLNTPFTIEAVWTNVNSDHDTFVFVPNEAGESFPSPAIDFGCNPEESACELDIYPFICVSQDARGPGDEVTTVRQLIPGTYEYWIELDDLSPAGDLTVTLRNANGRILRTWTSPENPNVNTQVGWHVFDINGQTKLITSIDQVIDDGLPDGAHDPNTDVCP